VLKTITLLLPLVAIAALLTGQRLRRFPPDMLGLRRPEPLIMAGWLAVWIGWMAITEFVSVRLGVEPPRPWHYPIGMTLLRIAMIGIAGPIAVELVYRGALLYALRVRAGLPTAVAIVLVSIVWAASHLQYDVTTLAMIFVDGIVLGAARVQSRSIVTPGAMHVIGNLFSVYQSLRGTHGG
jgi:membrane protease YdiL (CAAX protease family)